MDWKENAYFKAKGCINFNENKFRYMNLNPGGIPGQEDQLFQIIKFFNKEKTNREIAMIIKEEKTNKGVMRIKSYSSILKKYINCTTHKINQRVKEFPNNITFNTTWVIVQIKDSIELYNSKEGKFYGCHRISENSKITRYWEVLNEVL